MSCPNGKIINPVTGRCVDVFGKIGKLLVSKEKLTNSKVIRTSKLNQIMKLPDALTANYLVLVTGHTSRLALAYADPAMHVSNSFEMITSLPIVCIKDNKHGNAATKWITYYPDDDRRYIDEANTVKSMLDMYKLDGVVVFRLADKSLDGESPFFALHTFHSVFGSNNEKRYCDFFNGIPEDIRFFKHKGLGSVVLMHFGSFH